MATTSLVLISLLSTLLSLGQFASGATSAVSCGNCRVPKFQDRDFWLPFCAENEEGVKTTYNNVCEAICHKNFSKGESYLYLESEFLSSVGFPN